jgi:hypothetical protein
VQVEGAAYVVAVGQEGEGVGPDLDDWHQSRGWR